MQALRKVLRRVWAWPFVAIACVALLKFSVQGHGNAMRNIPDLQTWPQYAMTAAQFLYAALGPMVVGLRLACHDWLRPAVIAWGLSLTACVGLIPWAWIGPSVWMTLGFTAAGLALACVLGALVLIGSRPKR